MNAKSISIHVHKDNGIWKSHVKIQNDVGAIWEKKDDGETFDEACALALVQFQAFVKSVKGLPPAGVKFGRLKEES